MMLVGQYDSPYVRRVAITMHLLGLAFERNTMSGFGEPDAMRKINPLGRIPSLVLIQVDSGLAALEAAAPFEGWFLGGDRPMQPDITTACLVAHLRLRLPDAFPSGRHPRLEGFAARFDALPAFQGTRPQPFEAMPPVPLR